MVKFEKVSEIKLNNNFAIEVQGLSKSFGTFKALDNLELTIKKGEIYGLIGPNGSGKTTTISILLGILDADAGAKINVLNAPIPSQLKEVYPFIGYMPQDISLYMDLSIEQNLTFFGRLYGLSAKKRNERIKDVLALVDLTEFKDRVLSKCSGGMQRRCSLAVTLLNKPQLLILDEPTVGIDPELRNIFWDYFRRICVSEGTTILITTHYLAESMRCDRVGFIHKRIIVSGKPIELQEQVQHATKSSKLPDMEDVFIYFHNLNKDSGCNPNCNGSGIEGGKGGKF